MYTPRSHMSAVEYTCAYHRPTMTKSSKSQGYDKFVSSYRFPSHPTKQNKQVGKPQPSIYTNHIRV